MRSNLAPTRPVTAAAVLIFVCVMAAPSARAHAAKAPAAAAPDVRVERSH